MNTENITKVISAFEMYASCWNPVLFSGFDVGNISMLNCLISSTALSGYGVTNTMAVSTVSAANITTLATMIYYNVSALNV